MRRPIVLIMTALLLWMPPMVVAGRAGAAAQDTITPAVVAAAIDRLGDLEYSTRVEAARTIRRAPKDVAVAALVQAAVEHADGYVRYRALVILSGYGDPRGTDVMRRVLTDPNDRLREVAYAHFSHHPEEAVVATLLKASATEESEFVRPALMRALAAHGSDARVAETIVRETGRGQDFFRSAVIDALGEFKASHAVAALIAIARLDGPLQDDAVLALGRIGDQRALETFASLQRSAPRNAQPAIAAAICLLGINCSAHQTFVEETLRFAVANPGYQDLLRSAASAQAALAESGSAQALGVLLDTGIPATEPARAPIALAVGSVAMRNPPLLVSALETHGDRTGAIELVRDAFDMLEEAYEEEQFFAYVRQAYWKAPEGAPRRDVCAALIEKLEF